LKAKGRTLPENPAYKRVTRLYVGKLVGVCNPRTGQQGEDRGYRDACFVTVQLSSQEDVI